MSCSLPIPALSVPTSALLRELMLRSARAVGVPDIMLWLVDPMEMHLHATLGVGPQSAQFEGKFSQPLGEGLISVVRQTGQAICRNNVTADPSHSTQLDKLISQHTHAMVAAPIRLGDTVAGVISCAAVSTISGATKPRAFEAADLREIEFLAACVGRILLAESFDDAT